MESQFIHKVIPSFQLWVEHELVSDNCKAYNTNQSNNFAYVTGYNDIPPNLFHGYQGRFRQLVADYNVDVPNSGIFVNGNFVSGDSSDVMIDYNDGRVIVPFASGTGLTITANNTVKEVNVYITEDDEEKLLVQGDFIDSASPLMTQLFANEDKRDDSTYILPAVFLKLETDVNNPVALGGEVDTRIKIRMIVLSFSNYITDGVLSHFKDQDKTCIKLVPFGDYPYGRAFTLKSYPYKYTDLAANYTENMYVESVMTSKITKSLTLEKLQKNLIMGFADFDLSIYRYPNA